MASKTVTEAGCYLLFTIYHLRLVQIETRKPDGSDD